MDWMEDHKLELAPEKTEVVILNEVGRQRNTPQASNGVEVSTKGKYIKMAVNKV